jgi:UDP-3-O-[3-hydroxymyristoyl] glucosamine N-acyltransferase
MRDPPGSSAPQDAWDPGRVRSMAAHTLSELALAAGAELLGDGSYVVEGTAGLAEASPREVSFCAQPRYQSLLASTAAGAVVVPPGMETVRSDLHLLVHRDPNAAFTSICALFAAERARPAPGVDPRAEVHASAELGADVSIGAFVSVGARARLGERTVLHPGVRVGPGVVIGADCEIHANTVLYEGVQLGARCIVHAGVVLGGDGFGYQPPSDKGGAWTRIPHSGRVEIEDDVEIGAGSTVDRGRFGATRIGRGAKLDNLVHIGHNCVVGAGSMLAAQVGLAGSTRLGRGVQLGGQVGVGGHVEIGDGARLGGQTGVIGDIEAGSEMWGTPARPRREFFRQIAALGQLERLRRRTADLERRLAALEGRAQAGVEEQRP